MGELVLLRHGETVGQSSIRLYGATDIALSELGERQVGRAAAALRDKRFDAIVVSPLQRSRRSGEIVAAGREPAPPFRVVEAFREINFGEWEGWTFAEAEQRDPEGYQRWSTQGLEFQYPGGDSRGGFRQRVLDGLSDALFPTNERTLGALHKGIIKIVISGLTGMTHDEVRTLPVSLGGFYRLRHDGSRWSLASGHEHRHLGDLDIGG